MNRMACAVGAILLSAGTARACDACGCSAAQPSLGLLPQFTQSFVGITYQHQSFHSNYPAIIDGNPDETARQYYNTFQAWGRYQAGKRVQIYGFVPYRYNLYTNNKGLQTSSSGLGDVSALVNVSILKSNTPDSKTRQTLLIGGGAKAPTGHHEGITELDRQGLPNVQPGSGAWDFLTSANYTLSTEKLGFNTDLSYTMTTANRDDYKYGNRFSAGLVGFYRVKTDAVQVLPQLGARYEHMLRDYEQYSHGWLNYQSGGPIVFAQAGVQAYYQRFGLTATYYQPVYENYSNGRVSPNSRFDVGLLFLL